MSRFRNVCFTSFICPTMDQKELEYYIYQKEKCPTTGREHWQGYLELKKQSYKSAVQRIIGDPVAHIEARRGTQADAIRYCKKDESAVPGSRIEWGTPKKQGRRNDLEQVSRQIFEEKYDISEIATENQSLFIHYHSGIKAALAIRDEIDTLQALKLEMSSAVLNSFQATIFEFLMEQNNRQILWITDREGGKGKTFLSKYLVAEWDAFRCSNGKNSDIALAYNGEPIFIMDLSRTCEEYVNYDIIEQVKNGILFSGKYESKNKVFPVPRVLILSNFEPDRNKLTADRWQPFDIRT